MPAKIVEMKYLNKSEWQLLLHIIHYGTVKYDISCNSLFIICPLLCFCFLFFPSLFFVLLFSLVVLVTKNKNPDIGDFKSLKYHPCLDSSPDKHCSSGGLVGGPKPEASLGTTLALYCMREINIKSEGKWFSLGETMLSL